MDDKEYALYDLKLPKELLNLSKAIRYSHAILEHLVQLECVNYEKLTIITLYRKLIENVDGIFVLADHRLDGPSTSVLRAAYEVYLQIEYTFKEKSILPRKALSYYSCWLYEEIEFIRKELKKEKTLISKEKLLSKLEANSKLLDKEFSLYKNEIIRTKKKLNLKHPPKWYSLFKGPKNLSELSKQTHLKHAHKVLYGGFSAVAHGINSITDISNSTGTLELLPIRKNDKLILNTPIVLGRTFLTTITHEIIKYYLPFKLSEFKEIFLHLVDDVNIDSKLN